MYSKVTQTNSVIIGGEDDEKLKKNTGTKTAVKRLLLIGIALCDKDGA